MADIMNTALSALVSYQTALATTSHNIANVNTDGYSRQTVSLETNLPEARGYGSVGTGVHVGDIERAFDQFVNDQMRSSSTSYNYAQTYTDLASQIDSLLSNAQNGISGSLTSFFNSVQLLSDDPTSLPARQSLIAEGNTLASRLDAVNQQFGQVEQEINARLQNSVQEINGLTARIAELNESINIMRARSGGSAPNDLLDQRDQAIFELASYLDIRVVEQDGKTLNLYTAGGDALVLNESNFELGLERSEFSPDRYEVTVQTSVGSLNINSHINGGELGGVLNFRDEVMDPAVAQIGRLAYGLVSTINEQHRSGMTLNGVMGGDFFSLPSPSTTASNKNTGTGTATATISDISQVGLQDFVLTFDGATYQLFDATTGSAVPMTGTGTVADPFVFQGVSVVVGGAPAAGDRYLIQPTSRLTGELEVAVKNPSDIAAAAATRVSSSISNSGDIHLVSTSVIDATDPNLLNTSTIQFLDASTYQINGAGSFAYAAGGFIDINGTRVVLEGTPVAGDSFTISANVGGSGDNRNALALAAIQDTGIFDNGTTSVMDSAAGILSDVAVATRTSSIQAKSQLSLLQQNVNRRESISGVNLEEEAANMLRYQQFYQAAAQAVSVSNSVFDTLINAFR